MTRVVHVFTSAKFVPFVLPLLKGLKARGYEVCAVSGDGQELLEVEALGIAVHRLPMTRRVTPLADLKSVVRLMRLLATISPDLVHAHNPKAGLLAMLAASVLRLSPRIYHAHGSPLLTAEGLKRALFWLTESMSHSLATAPLAVSASLRTALGAAGVRGATRASVLGRGSAAGVDTNLFQRSPGKIRGVAFRERHGLDPRTLVLGFAGRYIEEKGLRELCAAWPQILDRFPQAWLFLAGAPDGVEPASMTELRHLPHVVDLGFLSDMAPFYEAIDVLALPSYREGLSTVTLESLAFEVPVIATETVGTVDAVQPGLTGLLIPRRDAAALARAVCDLFERSAFRNELGHRGRTLVTRFYEREEMLKALVAFYSELGFPPA
jgi:glycosyltransferase involved in cell wall biosynthesis